MNGHLAAIFTMMCCITLIDSIFLYITCNVLANVKYFYSIGCVLGILGVVTGPFGGQTANFAFDPLDKKIYKFMAVTFAEYQRRCLEMSPGISPPRSSAVFEAGGFDSRQQIGWWVESYKVAYH